MSTDLQYCILYFNLGAWGFVCSGEAHQSNGGFKEGPGWAMALPDFWLDPYLTP